MLKQVLAIVVIGTAALTSVAACASDWGTGASGYASPTTVQYVHNGPPIRYISPRYYPAYRWAPAPYRWAPPHQYWYPRYGYNRYDYNRHDYNPGYYNNGRNDWHGADQRRDWDRDDHRGDDDDRNDWHGR